MGEMNQIQANARRRQYVERYQRAAERMNRNLEDMDFLNAAERDKLKEYAADVRRICNRCIGSLNSLPFS